MRYPIDFSDYYQHIENRYERYGEENPLLPSFVRIGRIEASNGTMLVIGSDKKQFYPLLATIKSALNTVSFDAITIIHEQSILIKEMNPPHSATRLSSKKPPYRQFHHSVKTFDNVING